MGFFSLVCEYMNEDVIRDVAIRTKGEIYLGVVGSVRSGKSTFIRRFMEQKVLPLIDDTDFHQKVLDELPQSAEGKTIMTVEPKFIPSNNIKINIQNDVSCSIRLVDCVGFVIPNAKGYLNDDGSNRMVKTPWFNEEIPFQDAATIGTKKVIESHSNIGIVVTSDGSFGDFTRSDYESVEENVIDNLISLEKPFVIVLNTTDPYSPTSIALVQELSEKYNVSVIAVDAAKMTSDEVDEILKKALDEFTIAEMNINVPDWVDSLNDNISYKHSFNEVINNTTTNYRKMKDIFRIQDELRNSNLFDSVTITDINPGVGSATLDITLDDGIYESILTEIIGEDVSNKAHYIEILQEMAEAKNTYSKLAPALKNLNDCGYGIAVPTPDEMVLATPELVKQSGRYGIKLKATASAIHLVKVDVESTFEPIIGSQEQSQVLLEHMLENYEHNPKVIWDSEIFGRKLSDVICDGIKSKIHNVPDSIQTKYKESLTKVVNEGKGGVIAIVL